MGWGDIESPDVKLIRSLTTTRKVMFSVVSVCSGVGEINHYPWCIGPHCTGPLQHGTRSTALRPIPPQIFDLTVHPFPSPPWPPSRYRTTVQGPLLVTSDDHHWRPVQTCSLQDTPQTDADIWWLLTHIWSAQAGNTHRTRMLSRNFPAKSPNQLPRTPLHLNVTEFTALPTQNPIGF